MPKLALKYRMVDMPSPVYTRLIFLQYHITTFCLDEVNIRAKLSLEWCYSMNVPFV